MSVDTVIDIAKTILTIEVTLPDGQIIRRTIFNTPDQVAIKMLFSLQPKLGVPLPKSEKRKVLYYLF